MGIPVEQCDGERVTGNYVCWPEDRSPLKVRASLINVGLGPNFYSYFSGLPQGSFSMVRYSSTLFKYTSGNWILYWELGSNYSMFGWYHPTLGSLATSNIASRCGTLFWGEFYNYIDVITSIGAIVCPCGDEFEGVSCQSVAKSLGVPIQSGLFAEGIGLGNDKGAIRLVNNRDGTNIKYKF